MHRRQFNQAGASVLGAFFLAAHQQAYALSMGDLNGVSHAEASTGLKVALEKGAIAAVALLGRRMDFWAILKFAFLCQATWKTCQSC